MIAHRLALCGFGDSLYNAAKSLPRQTLVHFLKGWRDSVRDELQTNKMGLLGKKHPKLANIPDSFPNIDVLLLYVNPITSETIGNADHYRGLTWDKEPDLGKLAGICESSFEWGDQEVILHRFRTIIWHPAVLRILRRAALILDSANDETLTISKDVLSPGTTSKIISRYFCPQAGNIPAYRSDEGNPRDEQLIIKIHSSRSHVSTDGLLEYRVEIAPAQLVRIAKLGIKGLRTLEGPREVVFTLEEEELEGEEDEENDEEDKGSLPSKLGNHMRHLRLWMPACMVNFVSPGLVVEYETIQTQKLKKSVVSRPSSKTYSGKASNATVLSPSPSKPRVEHLSPDMSKQQYSIRDLTRMKSTPQAPGALYAERPKHFVRDLTKKSTPQALGALHAEQPKHFIRDLTKRPKHQALGASRTSLKSFFSTTRPARRSRSAPKSHIGSENALKFARKSVGHTSPQSTKPSPRIMDVIDISSDSELEASPIHPPATIEGNHPALSLHSKAKKSSQPAEILVISDSESDFEISSISHLSSFRGGGESVHYNILPSGVLEIFSDDEEDKPKEHTITHQRKMLVNSAELKIIEDVIDLTM